MLCNLQRYATHDGPGIRTVVFFKGCSLSCRWCQNPESQSLKADLLFDERLCLEHCQRCNSQTFCIQKQPHSTQVVINRHALTTDLKIELAECCPTGAMSLCGEDIAVETLLSRLMKDRSFYQRSQGGVTLSGGEPFMHREYLLALIQRLALEKIHTAAETCLHVPWAYIDPAVQFINLWLIDIKHTDPEKFSVWTKGKLSLIESNLTKLGQAGADVVFRVPIIPGFNATQTELKEIIHQAADFYDRFGGGRELHLLPYHTYGIHKYHLLGLPYSCDTEALNEPELLERAEAYASQVGLNVIFRG